MSCINVSVQHLKSGLHLEYTKEDSISADISRVDCDKLSVSFGIICAATNSLGWEFDQLVWGYEEHLNNVVKYNILRSKQDWYLEEMIFEEIF
mgnify:CR=1 FL=1